MFVLKYLETLPWIYSALFLVCIFIGLTVITILVVRKAVGPIRLKAHHDVAGFVFTNLGVLYSVLIGFTVVNVQQRFDTLKQIATKEAGYLAELYRDAEVFPEKQRADVRNAIKYYGQSVLDEEWGLIEHGGESLVTREAMHSIWKAYYAIDPKTEAQKAWYAQSLQTLNNFLETRLERILGGEESLSHELWVFLVAGGVIMVTFVGFFGLESLTFHIAMASILAASTGFLLFLIYSLDTAFTGAVSIPPDPLVGVLESFQ